MQLLKVFYLSIGSLGVSRVSKSIMDSLESADGRCLFVPNLPDLTIATLTHFDKRFIEFNEFCISDSPVLVHDYLQ